MNTKMSKIALFVGALAATGGVWAASDTAHLDVGATVNNACAIGEGYLSFGTIALPVNSGVGTRDSSLAIDASAAVPVVCTNGATAAITGDMGLNGGGSSRKMASGSDLLGYQLYTSSARTTVLDTGTGAIPYTGTGSTESVLIYGRMEVADIMMAKRGNYNDTVQLTITYSP